MRQYEPNYFVLIFMCVCLHQEKSRKCVTFFFLSQILFLWPCLPEVMDAIEGPLGYSVVCWIPLLTLGD